MITDKEKLWLKRIQHRLMFEEWRGPGGRLLRKRRLQKKCLKYMERYSVALMDGVAE